MPDEFDRTSLTLMPLSKRNHLLDRRIIMPLQYEGDPHPSLISVARRIQLTRELNSSVILMMGAHVIRSGVQRFIIDLMEKKFIDCIAMNGAGVIHDYEISLIGATTESVADYIRTGEFGFWEETGRINDIVNHASRNSMGLGEAVGRVIEEEKFPFRDSSLLAAGYRMGIPVTVHVGIGCDIIHQHPNCDGGAYGKTSYTDFLRYAAVLEQIEGGVVMNFGSAVMAPEIYLKALSMVRNAAFGEGCEIKKITTLVCDLAHLPENFRQQPSKDTHGYYFRPWKTMLVRTVADGGESFYVRGNHADTIPQLWRAIYDPITTVKTGP